MILPTGKVFFQCFIAGVVNLKDGIVFKAAVEPLNLTISPGVSEFGHLVFDLVSLAGQGKGMGFLLPAFVSWFLVLRHAPIGELASVIRQYSVDGIREKVNQRFQELNTLLFRTLLDHPDKGRFGNTVNGSIGIPSFEVAGQLGQINGVYMDKTGKVLTKLTFSLQLFGQTIEAVFNQGSVAIRAVDCTDMGFEQINNIIKGQLEMFPSNGNNPLLLFGQRVSDPLRTVRVVFRRLPILPFGHCFRVELEPFG